MEKEIDKNVLIGRSEYSIYVSKTDVTSWTFRLSTPEGYSGYKKVCPASL
jgi:hypothetical protein